MPAGDAPTTSSFSTEHLGSMNSHDSQIPIGIAASGSRDW